MLKCNCICAFSLVVVFLTGGIAGATVINVDLVPDGDTVYSGTAAASDSETFWNTCASYSWVEATVSDLTASDGTTSTEIDFTITNVGGMGYGGPAGTYRDLLGDGGVVFLWAPGNLTLSDLPSDQTYDLYLYSTANENAEGGKFTIGSEARWTAGGNMTSIVEGGLASNPLVTGSNYVLFSDLTADAENKITIGYESNGVTDYGPFNGLQLVSSPIPEPSTFLLIVTGIFGLLAYAWRKRK